MSLRQRFSDDLKTAMRSGDSARISTLRLIQAKLKEADIAARPGPPLEEAAIIALLRSMVKARTEAAALYRQGGREELAAKEEAEIALIESYLPQPMDEAEIAAAITAAIAETGASTAKDMGKVMATLKAKYGARLDLAKAGPLVKARLGP